MSVDPLPAAILIGCVVILPWTWYDSWRKRRAKSKRKYDPEASKKELLK